jgi:hypothetical protein
MDRRRISRASRRPKVIALMRQVQIVVGSLAAIGAILALVVSRWFAILPLFVGSVLLVAGVSGKCGLALLLARMPCNHEQNACSHCSTKE